MLIVALENYSDRGWAMVELWILSVMK